MKIFISWSGDSSNQYASALKKWMPCVLQSVDVFMSSHDIEKGERWLASIFKNLEDISFGIVVLTPENINAPWVLFEAGALSKDLDKSRLIPILCGVSDSDLSKNPLSSFQYVKNDKQGIIEMLVAINANNLERSLDDEVLRKSIEVWWSEFESATSSLKFERPKKRQAPTEETIEGVGQRVSRMELAMDEVLYSVRQLRNRDKVSRKPNAALIEELTRLSERREALRKRLAHEVRDEFRSEVEEEIDRLEMEISLIRSNM